MDWKVFFATFGMVFLAEMGDKTQIAAVAMSADTRAPLSVFLGAASALLLATLFGVLLGGTISRLVSLVFIKRAAGIVLIAAGIAVLWGKL